MANFGFGKLHQSELFVCVFEMLLK